MTNFFSQEQNNKRTKLKKPHFFYGRCFYAQLSKKQKPRIITDNLKQAGPRDETGFIIKY